MRKYFFFWVLVLFGNCSTPDEKEEGNPSKKYHYQKVGIKNFDSHDQISSIDTAFLRVMEFKDSKTYIYNVYNDPDSLLTYYSFQTSKSLDTLYLDGEACVLIKSNNYSIDQKNYEIKSYYYDRENSSDEESTIYFSKDYGVLIIFNDGWMVIAGIFEYDSISNNLVEMILSDSTHSFGFYGSGIRLD